MEQSFVFLFGHGGAYETMAKTIVKNICFLGDTKPLAHLMSLFGDMRDRN